MAYGNKKCVTATRDMIKRSNISFINIVIIQLNKVICYANCLDNKSKGNK